jgi:hypothetical protein
MACIYKSETGTCYRSTSKHHCKLVNNTDCENCDLCQTTKIVSDKTRIQRIIKESIALLKEKDIEEAMRILNKAMEI